MFEVKIQTYWSDADPAGIVFFANYFRFVEQAEHELFQAAGIQRHKVMEEYRVWLPRVEAFAKFVAPIRHESAIRVRLKPSIKGEKTIRYDFDILDDENSATLAHGYVTVVCVDRDRFKSTPIPGVMRKALGL